MLNTEESYFVLEHFIQFQSITVGIIPKIPQSSKYICLDNVFHFGAYTFATLPNFHFTKNVTARNMWCFSCGGFVNVGGTSRSNHTSRGVRYLIVCR